MLLIHLLQRESFVKSVSSNTVQNFLDWFSESTMFTAFIESRLDRSVDPRGEFRIILLKINSYETFIFISQSL